MGTNRRYAHSIDKRMDDRILESLTRAGTLQSLTREELDLDHQPVTTDPKPGKVRAWVRFGPQPVRVDAVAAMWTKDAVAISFHVGEREYRAWVWTNAVTPCPSASR
jgi:hypothetical protein